MVVSVQAGEGEHLLLHRTQQQVTNHDGIESHVDDLKEEQGIVRARVAVVLRSAEILPLFFSNFYLS